MERADGRLPMDANSEHATEALSTGFDIIPPTHASPLDPSEAFDLHRAINERRSQVENTELLRNLRSL